MKAMANETAPKKRGRPPKETVEEDSVTVEDDKDDIIAQMEAEETQMIEDQKREMEEAKIANDAASIIENRIEYVEAGNPEAILDSTNNPHGDRICVYMRSGYAWVAANGVKFSKEQPFHVLPRHEAEPLLRQERFKIATREEVESFYKMNRV